MTGIMGGTFNPIHYGHLRLAEHIREEFGLSGMLFVPAGTPPHKADQRLLSVTHRLEMTGLAIADNPFFQLSRIEASRTGYSYTAETLELLGQEGHGPLSLLMGADSVLQMLQWHEPERILSKARILVAQRPEVSADDLQSAIEAIQEKHGGTFLVSTATAMPHASSDIRVEAALGRSIRYLVPEPVRDYILTHRLYLEPSSQKMNC